MRTFKILLTLFVLSSIISSCRKDSITTDMEFNPPTPQINIEVELNGFITDLNGFPVEDATVKILNEMTVTNELGYFEMEGLVNEKYAVIEVEKSGYFKQFETIIPSKTAVNRTRIKLIDKILTESFASSSGGTVGFNNESSVDFQSNSFIDQNGNPYSGAVNVFTFYIDPTHEDIDQIMPGNLMAMNTENNRNILQSFGMINVELEGENGEKLDINKPATITVGVPSTISNNAPTEIPLWYFDETNGLWVEEGNATLANGKYTGEVNHFTFWNCDVPNEFTFITGQIFDSKGISITRVRITDLSTGASYTSWTDSEGVFSGGVPQGANLLLEVLGFCGDNVIFSTNIGPFTEDEVDLGTFNISNNTSFSLVTGTLVDCDQAPLENGQVYINLPNQFFTQQTTTDASGNFSALIPTCPGEEIEIRGFDVNTELVSQKVTVLPSNNIDIGQLEVCANISASLGSVIFNLPGEQKIFDNCTVTINQNNQGNTSYLLTYFELLPPVNDTFPYYWILTDLNNDINNPSWDALSVLYSPPASAENELYYVYTPFFQQGFTNISVDQVAVNSGDIMKLSISNLKVGRRINDPNGPNILTNFENNTMEINAVLQ